jgi:hypothetical protein
MPMVFQLKGTLQPEKQCHFFFMDTRFDFYVLLTTLWLTPIAKGDRPGAGREILSGNSIH